VYDIFIEDTGERFRCSPEVNVLRAMAQLGRKGIPAGCRNGGCGVCKVHVIEGTFRADVMSRAWVSEDEQAEGTALACRIYPLTNLRVRVLGQMRRTITRSGGLQEAALPSRPLPPR
jgi:ferredoxin